MNSKFSGCATGEFMCENENKCIPNSWLCDFNNDCDSDSSDESPVICHGKKKSFLSWPFAKYRNMR